MTIAPTKTVAICPVDHEPLVFTLAFRKNEFYCLSCGSKYGWFGPDAAEETLDLVVRVAEVEAEWRELSAGLISQGGYYDACATCQKHESPHEDHAFPSEIEEHEAAKLRLRLRAIRPPR